MEWKVSELDESHTGEVVLCCALDEQDGYEHMPDEYERPIYYCIAEDPILSTTDNKRSPHIESNYRTDECGEGQTNKQVISQTRIVDQLPKLSCILIVRIFQ